MYLLKNILFRVTSNAKSAICADDWPLRKACKAGDCSTKVGRDCLKVSMNQGSTVLLDNILSTSNAKSSIWADGGDGGLGIWRGQNIVHRTFHKKKIQDYVPEHVLAGPMAAAAAAE